MIIALKNYFKTLEIEIYWATALKLAQDEVKGITRWLWKSDGDISTDLVT